MVYFFLKRKFGDIASINPSLLLAVGLMAGITVFADEAHAYSLFGVHLFGEKEQELEAVKDPVNYAVTFNVKGGDKTLDSFLRNRSELLNDERAPVDGDLGLLVKARDDLQILVGSLYEKAYYGGLVEINIDGQPIKDIIGLPNFDRDNPVPITVTINTGPQFSFAKIDFQGSAETFDPAELTLVSGAPAYSTSILSAARSIITDLKNSGHPFAKIVNRDVVANHQNATVDVIIKADAGPKANLGSVVIKGSDAVNPNFIKKYSRLKAGQPYSPQELNEAANRLRKLSTFSSVNITTASTLDTDGQLPTTINVKAGKQRYFGFGAKISSIDGLGIESYWGHRNFFSKAEGLKLEAGVSRIGTNGELDGLDLTGGLTFTKPGLFYPSGMFTASLTTNTENPDPYKAKSVATTASYTYEQSDYNTISLTAASNFSRIKDAFGTNDYLTFSVPFAYDRDTRNDTLNPTEGIHLTTSVTPSHDFLGNTFYTSFNATGSTYLSAGDDDRFVLAARLGTGTIVGGDNIREIPANQRFYSGGGGSVRGYPYKTISPRNTNGDETGGRSYIEASLEARIAITENIQIVPFVDAADVSSSPFPDFSDIRASAGLGLRYMTSFGPIRVDVALPLDRYSGDKKYGIYAGIGQSF